MARTITTHALLTYGAIALSSIALTAITTAPALADDDAVELVTCDQSIGTIALIDSPSAGWSQWDLGSPRMLITQLATESGCFTPHAAGSSEPARFLVTAIAGSQEDVDQSINLAKSAATEAFVRSGAAARVLSSVPFGGAAAGLIGGLGGRRTTVAAGLTMVSPANGQQLAAGSGSVSRSSLSFRGNSGGWARAVAGTTGYADSSNGRKLTEAYIIAFNQLVAQRAALEAAPAPGAGTTPAAAEPGAVVAVDTAMRASASAQAAAVRALRAGTELTPTGTRDGLWIEVTDNYGTRGWVSVESLQ